MRHLKPASIIVMFLVFIGLLLTGSWCVSTCNATPFMASDIETYTSIWTNTSSSNVGALSGSEAVSINFNWNDNYSTNVAPVPEPGTLLLMGVGMVGLAVVGRRRFKKGRC